MTNSRQSLELADVFKRHGKQFLQYNSLCANQHKAFHDIIQCRSAELGGHVEACKKCGYTRYAYNSCRNRHCPKCQYVKQLQWVDKLKAKLPPVRYFHLVFTIPESLRKLFLLNQATAYSLLFKASAEALKKCTENPQLLGAQTAAVAVLHTWGQTLSYHPHIHMIVPAGGLSEDGMEWIPSDSRFLIPVKVLSSIFRGIYCRLLEKAIKEKQIKLPENFARFSQLKKKLYEKRWNVYAKKPMAGPEKVVEYLGKYSHRVAISNHRLLKDENGWVSFRCKDAQTGKFTRIVKLQADEFIRRFMMHVLPCGFYKIRYYGFIAPVNRKEKSELCFELVENKAYLSTLEGLPAIDVLRMATHIDPLYCPKCKKGTMHAVLVAENKKTKPG